MNLHEASFEDYLDILVRAKILHTQTTLGGLNIHVAEYAGNDVFIINEPLTGGAVVIEKDDANYGGSIHDHLRHERAAGR